MMITITYSTLLCIEKRKLANMVSRSVVDTNSSNPDQAFYESGSRPEIFVTRNSNFLSSKKTQHISTLISMKDAHSQALG